MSYNPPLPSTIPGAILTTVIDSPFLSAPSIPGTSHSSSGGTIPNGTVSLLITYVTSFGETVPCSPSTVTLTGSGTSQFTVTSPADAGEGDTRVLGWNLYLYVASLTKYVLWNPVPLNIGSNQVVTTLLPDPDAFYSAPLVVNTAGTRRLTWRYPTGSNQTWTNVPDPNKPLPPPRPAPTATSALSGGALSPGTYSFALSYVNIYGETVVGTPGSATVSGGNDSFIVASPPDAGINDTAALTYNVYIWNSTLSVWKLVLAGTSIGSTGTVLFPAIDYLPNSLSISTANGTTQDWYTVPLPAEQIASLPGMTPSTEVIAPVLAAPAVCNATYATTTGSLVEGVYYAAVSYVTKYGETQVVTTAGHTFSGGSNTNKVTIASPPAAGSGDTAAIGYNAYFWELSPVSQGWYKLNDTPIALGTAKVVTSIDPDFNYTPNNALYNSYPKPGTKGALWSRPQATRKFWGSAPDGVTSLPQPHHAVTMTPHTTGGSIPDATYQVAVSYIYQPNDGNPLLAVGESGLSPATTVVVSGGSGSGSITVTAPPVIGQLGMLPTKFSVYMYDSVSAAWWNVDPSGNPTAITAGSCVVQYVNTYTHGPGGGTGAPGGAPGPAVVLANGWQGFDQIASGNNYPHALSSDVPILITDTLILTSNVAPLGLRTVVANVTLSCAGGDDIVELWFFDYYSYSTYSQGRWSMVDGQVMTVSLLCVENTTYAGYPKELHGQSTNGHVTALKDTPFAAASIGGGGYATSINTLAIQNF